jgi:hypothetical protein
MNPPRQRLCSLPASEQKEINVRDFIQQNDEPDEGDASD